ncbi:hypothetical protein [Haloprofundus salinisoli]|uniref:hypothetical protein n=1 Tax=Haloprofundus salinisoli TaxID=2876193 RepID=UPI001CCB9FA5|nr:hypothetical protein [Haloprofundus salinisoli]
MSSNSSSDSTDEVELINQTSISDRNRLSEFSIGTFDGVSVLLVGTAVVVGLLFYIHSIQESISIQDVSLVVIALLSAIFTLLSVRESKRTREASVAPTLFIGVQNNSRVGVLNLGKGPAHELSVTVSPIGESEMSRLLELETEIVQASDFCQLRHPAFDFDDRTGKELLFELEYKCNLGRSYQPARTVELENLPTRFYYSEPSK